MNEHSHSGSREMERASEEESIGLGHLMLGKDERRNWDYDLAYLTILAWELWSEIYPGGEYRRSGICGGEKGYYGGEWLIWGPAELKVVWDVLGKVPNEQLDVSVQRSQGRSNFNPWLEEEDINWGVWGVLRIQAWRMLTFKSRQRTAYGRVIRKIENERLISQKKEAGRFEN